VLEAEKKIYVVVSTADGKGYILTEDISDAELEVYRKYPDTYFGVVQPAGKQINDPYEFFEWFLNTYSKTPKEKLLEFMKGSPDIETLRALDQEELALEYCERMTHAAMRQQGQ